MTDKEFEELVNEGIAAIPAAFLRLVSNAAIVIEDEPTPQQRRTMRLTRSHTLLGLYEGIPRTARDRGYTGVLPDKITIFRRPILAAAGSPQEVRELVAETVWHEIAHHFGMDEGAVSRATRRRRSARGT